MKERNHQSLEPLMSLRFRCHPEPCHLHYSSQPCLLCGAPHRILGQFQTSTVEGTCTLEPISTSLSPLPLTSIVALVRHTISLLVSEHCPGDPRFCPRPTGQRGGAGAQHAATKVSHTCSLWASTALCGESLCLVHRLPL